MDRILGVLALVIIGYVLYSNVSWTVKNGAPAPYVAPAPDTLQAGTSPSLGMGTATSTTITGLGASAAIGGEIGFVSIEAT